jgi:hypothetical protein
MAIGVIGYTGAIATDTITATGRYNINAYGAAGGSSSLNQGGENAQAGRRKRFG